MNVKIRSNIEFWDYITKEVDVIVAAIIAAVVGLAIGIGAG